MSIGVSHPIGAEDHAPSWSVTASTLREDTTSDRDGKETCLFWPCRCFFHECYLTLHVGAQAAPLDLKFFKEAETIQLFPDALLIAGIDHLDVDPTGRVLVVDQKAGKSFCSTRRAFYRHHWIQPSATRASFLIQ